MNKPFWVLRWTVVLTIFGEITLIYVPNEIDQSPKPYTTGIKIKTSHYKTLTEPYYHSNYSKVYVHNKNYTSSLLDSANADSQTRTGQPLDVHPVYISEEKKKKIKNILTEHNTNVVDKDTLNNKVVYKRRIEKSKNIEVYNKCPKGATGQFVYDFSCNQFLDCWNGRGGPKNCAPGTLFNPKTLECDFPEKVECLTGPSASSGNIQRSAKLQVYEQAKCPEGFSGLIPNYTDCSKFIQCNSGIQNPGTCPPGTLFDTKLNVCNHPVKTTCFTGQSGAVYAIKEEIGGSTDQAKTYQGQTSQYNSHTGYSHVPQSGQYQAQSGQNFDGNGRYIGQQVYNGQPYQNGQFHEQSNYLGQNQQNPACDPTSPYCNSGGYVISGQNIYQYPPISQEGSTSSVTSNSFGQGSQYYGGSTQTSNNCNPQTQNCQPSQTGFKSGTVYIQFVMCNPIEDDCSSFQQGTFMLGPGGTLCNPLKQACKASESSYVPSNKMQEPTRSGGAGLAGTYYVKYITCNPHREDCSKYQQGIMEATYGVPGTLIGVRPVQDPECDPKIYNCNTIQYQGENKPNISTYDQIYGGRGPTSTTCNPTYQNCDGQVSLQGSKGRFPKKFNTTTNYKKVCSSGDEGCYQGRPSTETKIYNTNQNTIAEPICPNGFQGVTKHPTDCKKFLNCANGITYIQDCSPGTLFNPFIKTCDFAYNVDCKDSVESSTTYYDFDNQKPDYDQIQVRATPRPHSDDNQGKNTGHIQYPEYTNGCYGSQCSQNQIGQAQGQFPGLNAGEYQQGNCQGTHCTQNPEYTLQGQFEAGQGQNIENSYVHSYNKGPFDECQGPQCGQGQFSQGQVPYKGQHVGGYQPTGCQGSQCVNGLQGQPSRVYGQPQYNPLQHPTQNGCQGSNCHYIPQGQHQGEYQPQVSSSIYPEQTCKGNRCQKACQGRECGANQSPNLPGQHSVNDPSQIEDYGDQLGSYQTTTHRTYFPPTQSFRRPTQGQQDNEGHIMKIPGQKDHQGVAPVNKFDRVTHGGFNNQKSIDYVDIFSPDESRNIGYATTNKPSGKQVWPPPYPDLATSDPNADYVFEYEDGEPVTLAPEKVNLQKRKKTRCEDNDFVCDKRSCVSKNFVCDGVKDCDDGKDEKYCTTYLKQYKVYTNARLDVLERQRWDNVSYSTCALLCMDSKKFECKSFNYRKIDRTCFLTNENIGTSGALKSYYPCDYYERTAMSLDCSDMHKCPNEKCLTSDQVCDGYDDCGDRADEKGCRADDFGYQVRLAGGQSENEGRVEVTVFGKTGYICDDQFSLTDADVLCKELGFHLGAAEVKGNSFYAKDLKENHTLYMMDDIECLGNETSIMHCNFAGWGIHNCADNEIAGIVCRTPQESCSEGFWKCDTGNECVKLPFLCDDLDDCTDNSDEASHHCNAPTELRLVNGTSNNEGRLEIRHHGVWGSICDDDFNEDAAKIVCRHLGLPGGAYVKKEAFFGESSGPIWLDQVSCFGNETHLEKCAHWDWGDNNCDHSEDVGIVCSRDVIEVEAQRNSKAFGGEISGSIKDLGTSYSSPEPVSCGYRKDNIFLESDDVHFRVVQGSTARPGDYPWQAALRIKGQEKSAHWCGAVVVASKWVLTAAHCLEGYPKGSYVVVAGEYNIDEDEGTEQQAFIEEYYLHEHFREGHKMGNDIALIKLKGNGFRLNQDIQPICLPDEISDYERELNCTISGFGTVQTGKSAYSHKLRAAWIPVQKMDVCKMAHIYGEAITEGMICAGDLTGGGDACDGDSGGPLACLEDGVFTLYGLTSWGQRCGYANKPGVYVKVAHYKRWIDNIMKIHS